MSEHLTDRNFWESFWRSKKDLIFPVKKDYVFGDILAVKSKEVHAKTAIELGGFPGYYSIYFKKHLNLDTTLFDYFISKDIINELLMANQLNVNDIHIIEADLFNFQPDQQYDMVSSFGLIEHFGDTKDIISRHVQFLKPGGMLFITLPNFRSVNGWVQKTFDRSNYDKHNIRSMDPQFLSSIAHELGLKEVKAYYHGGFSVWLENQKQHTPLTRTLVKLLWYAGKIPTKLFGFESRMLSPYIILLGKR
ncbi:MAG TPA: class I SAM-dependent methyltransferase [Sphingobacteriaceae bacterium]|nr:class I SAM-dependent methyltransferase [Sphingobacteriaceae bacterium]